MRTPPQLAQDISGTATVISAVCCEITTTLETSADMVVEE